MSEHFLLMPQKNALDSKWENRNNCIYIKLDKNMYLLQYQPHPNPQKTNTPSTSPKHLIFLLGKSSGWIKRTFSK